MRTESLRAVDPNLPALDKEREFAFSNSDFERISKLARRYLPVGAEARHGL